MTSRRWYQPGAAPSDIAYSTGYGPTPSNITYSTAGGITLSHVGYPLGYKQQRSLIDGPHKG
jgi:hypothetical protein